MGYPDHSRLVSVGTELGMVRDVICYDDASGVMGWVLSGTGADPTLARSGTFAFRGANSWKLQTRSTTPADNDNAHMQLRFAYPFRDRVFIGVRVFAPDISELELAAVQLGLFDGVRMWQFTIYYSYDAAALTYLDAANSAVVIQADTVDTEDNSWIYLGMEVDLNTMTWVKGYGMGLIVDLAGVAPFDVGPSTKKQLELDLWMKTKGAQQADTYWDTIFASECECI